MKKVKSILFRAKLSGYGIVQTDSESQKGLLAKSKNYDGIDFSVKNQNGFSKKNFYIDKDGKVSFKIKIGHDCLMYSMRDGILSPSANIAKMGNKILAEVASEPINLLSGWLMPKDNQLSNKKKSSLYWFDAEQVSDTLPTLEVGNSHDIINQSNTSFFYTEKCGNIEYETSGEIGFKGLEMLMMDVDTDFVEYPEDGIKDLLECLNRKLPSKVEKPTYYRDKYSTLGGYQCFNGILFDGKNIEYLTKWFLKKLLNFSIKKKGSYVEMKSLEILPIYDSLLDNRSTSDDKWIKLLNEDDIDSISIEPEMYFESITEDDLQGKYGKYISDMEKLSITANTAKENKKAEKEKKKLEKEAALEAKRTAENKE